MKTGNFSIAGKWVSPVSARTIEVINPATELPCATVAMGNAEDADRAVQAAKRAFVGFSRTSKEERIDLLSTIASGYENRIDELARAMTLEMGAPSRLALEQQAQSGLSHLRKTIDCLQNFPFETMRGTTRVIHEAIGVAALITPWNWPMNQIVCKVAPAIAAGCTMVLKPSEQSPLSALVFAEIMDEAGVPAGVFNLVNGDGENVGSTLSGNSDVDVISITGSTRAGIQVAQAAAPTIKRVVQELGGKSPNILLDDCNLEDAVSRGVAACFSNSGQSCDAPTLMLVPEKLMERTKSIAKRTAQGIVVGDPTDDRTQLGPVANGTQFSKVRQMIDQGVADGATLVVGGPDRPEGLTRGYFIEPTVFGDVSPSMTIASEEIFGPVLSIMSYKNDEDAVQMVNNAPFGLAAYVQSKDHNRAGALARRLRAGQVHINYAEPDLTAPFGGYRQSGNGREYGEWGLRDFLEVKALVGYRCNASPHDRSHQTEATDLSKVAVNRHFGETAFADSKLRNGKIE